MERFLLGILGFLVFLGGGGIAISGLFLLLELRDDKNLLIIVPITSGLLGFYFFASGTIVCIKSIISRIIYRSDKIMRVIISIIIIWWGACLIYFIAFDPFGSRWAKEEWVQFFAIILGPPLLALLGAGLFTWVNRSD